MVIYRPHRGSLSDALAEAKVFNTVDEMFDYIRKNDRLKIIDYLSEHRNKLASEEERNKELSIDNNVVFDDRCGWNTQYVLCYGNCIGMCDLNWDASMD